MDSFQGVWIQKPPLNTPFVLLLDVMCLYQILVSKQMRA